jgi:hypothetical protein
MIGRSLEMNKISRVLQEAVVQHHSAIVPILGPYGMGKTFTLFQLREKFRSRIAPFKEHPVLGAYLTATKERFPSKYSLYVFTNVMEDVGEEVFFSLARKIKTDDGAQSLGFLRGDDIKSAIKSIQSERDTQIIWNWFRGGGIPGKKASELMIHTRINNDEEAMRMLTNISRLLAHSEYGAFVILMDELEQAYAQGASYARAITWARHWFDSINRAISESPEDVVPAVTLMGCAPETWNAITSVADKSKSKGAFGGIMAFLDRIPKENYVQLLPLDLPDIKKLLVSFVEGALQKSFKRPNDLYPFDEDSAKIVFELSQGVPRHVIRLARILLREADAENKPVTRDNCDRWLRKAKILTN